MSVNTAEIHILQLSTCCSLILLRRAQWAHEYVCSSEFTWSTCRAIKEHTHSCRSLEYEQVVYTFCKLITTDITK